MRPPSRPPVMDAELVVLELFDEAQSAAPVYVRVVACQLDPPKHGGQIPMSLGIRSRP